MKRGSYRDQTNADYASIDATIKEAKHALLLLKKHVQGKEEKKEFMDIYCGNKLLQEAIRNFTCVDDMVRWLCNRELYNLERSGELVLDGSVSYESDSYVSHLIGEVAI